ncbi:MAG: endonuclease/exonuclease/phosphatase family protein [Deltaproteobacteria bacterium]|nr:endonuclease/exonuclease/phosphatase family protein [Deltaproteobacteria bacterium]
MSPELMAEFQALWKEKDPELLYEGFSSFASRLERAGQAETAARVYASLLEALPEEADVGLRRRVTGRLNGIQGGGDFGNRAEFLLDRFAKDAFDPKTIAPMILGTSVFSLTRTLALGRFGSSALFRAIGPRFAASSLGFLTEVPAFALSSRALRGASAQEPSMGRELASAALTLGFLKGFGHGAQTLRTNPALGQNLRAPQLLLPQAAMFGGLMLAHQVEEGLGWRKPVDGATAATEVLAAMLSLGIGANLGQHLLGPRFQSTMRGMDLAFQAAANKASSRLNPLGGEWGPATAGAAPRSFQAAMPEGPGADSRSQMSATKLIQYDHAKEPSRSAPGELKVVTYNVGYASGEKNNTIEKPTTQEVYANLDAMIESLRRLAPDVLCLQEVDFASARSSQIDQLSYLARGLGTTFGAKAVTWDVAYLPFPFWPPRAHFGKVLSGQAILSRYPIVAQNSILFEKPPLNPFWYNPFYLDRIAQRATVDWDGHPVGLWNVHFEPFYHQHRMNQTMQLAERLRKEAGPYEIVAGDFNSSNRFTSKQLTVSQVDELMKITDKARYKEWIKAGKPIDNATVEAAKETASESVNTFLEVTGFQNAQPTKPADSLTFFTWGDGPFEKLDQITYSPIGWRQVNAGVVQDLKASDHAPLWTVLRRR